jgi:hypothetical protein
VAYVSKIQKTDQISEKKIEYLKKFLTIAQEYDILVTIFMTPIHPDALSQLQKNTVYTKNHQDIITSVKKIRRRVLNRIS